MSGFLHPLWLVALGIIPVIRWLHRWHAPLSSWPVSAIFLWERAGTDQQAGDKQEEPEAAWRRRALATALLVFALAGPYLSTETRVLSVWIDDSLSVYATENGKTRLASMLDTLSGELNRDPSRWSEITLRSLTNPGRVRRFTGSDSLNPDDWPMGPNSELDGDSMPVPGADSDHWLLTDGASGEIHTWAARVSLSRVIQSGEATENSAVTRLAARRSVADREIFDILVSVSNAGPAKDERQLSLYSGKDILQTTRLSLSPGQTSHWQVRVAAADQSLTALLTSADSLPGDDELSLSLQRLEPLTTHVDSVCGAALKRALATHPSLAFVAAATEAALIVSCSREHFAESGFAGARIRALLGGAEAISSPPVWLGRTGNSDDLSLSTDWISSAQWPQQAVANGPRVLLASAGKPLVVLHAADAGSSATVDTVINLAHPRFIRQAEYPAFIATLVDFATGRQLLDESIAISRESDNSVIIPQSLDDAGPGVSRPFNQATIRLLSWPFLLAALLLLLLDAALLLRARKEARRG